jgi:actin
MVDIGSYNIKAGFSGDDAPKVIMPTVIGRAKSKGVLVGMDQKDFFVGNEALSKKNALNLNYPVQNGLIDEDNEQDMEDIDHILKQMMNTELKCSFDDQKVMLSEPPNNKMEQRKMMAEKMFEEFNVKSLYFAPQPVLSLYASARTTGTVIDSGHGATHAVPIYEGYYIPHAT